MRICRLWLRHEASHPILERQRIRLLLARAQAESRQSRQALDTLAHALPVKGDSVRGGSLQYADQLYLAQEYDRAAEQYARAIQGSMSSSDGEWARLQLAKVRRTQKRYDEARTLLHEVQSMATDDLVARISAALLADLPETKKKAGG